MEVTVYPEMKLNIRVLNSTMFLNTFEMVMAHTYDKWQ